MKESDRLLIEGLEALDPSTLTPEGRQFRETGIKFMDSPMAKVVVKPVSAIFRKREPTGSSFPDVEAAQAHFGPLRIIERRQSLKKPARYRRK